MMELFDFSKKKKTEDAFREKIRDAFEESVRDVKKELVGEPMIDGLMVQAAIGVTRQSLLETSELQILGLMSNLNLEEIIDEECKRVMQKYLT